jgi:hypothetical protein
MVFDAGNGAEEFRGWFDEAYGTPCIMEFMSDGRAHCVPLGVMYLTGPGSLSYLGYLDSACSQPALDSALYGMCGATATMALDWDTSSCPGVFTVSSLGPVQSAPLWYHSSGQCVAATGGASQAWPVLGEIPPTSFVAAHEEDSPLGNGLALRRVVAEDGASVSVGVIDATHAQPCAIGSTDSINGGAYDGRCLPIAGYDSSVVFSDSQCKVAATVYVKNSQGYQVDRGGIPYCQGTEGFVAIMGPSANTLKELRTIGTKLDPSVYYTTAYGGGCKPLTATGPIEIYDLGNVVPPQDFPVLQRVTVGTGRIRTRALAGSDGQPILATGLDDALTGECWPSRFETGPVCAPYSSGLEKTAFFFDSACSQPVFASAYDALQEHLTWKAQPGSQSQCAQSVFLQTAPDSTVEVATITSSFQRMDISGGVWTLSGGACLPAQYPDTSTTYASTGIVDPAALLAPIVERVE